LNKPRRVDQHPNTLITGSTSRTLLLFALPTLGSTVLQSVNSSINTMWVGRFLGEEALAATSNANMLLFLAFCLVFGFGMAATILVAQYAGRADTQGVRRVVGAACGLLIMLSIGVATVGWILAPVILRVLGTPSAAAGMALAYLRVILLSMPPIMLLALLAMTLRGIGNAMIPLWVMAVVAALDMGLNPLLILGIAPLPRLGIAGAAAATGIANVIGVVLFLIIIYRRDLSVRLRGREWRYLLPERALLKTLAIKGVPMGLQMIVTALSALAMLGLVNRQGVVTTAAYGAVIQLWTYVQMPAMALGTAVSAMAAQNIGARQWHRLPEITRAGIGINVLMTGAAILALTVIDRPALSLFLGANSVALGIARHIDRLVNWSFVFFGVSMVLTSVVRANGAVVVPLILLIISRLPLQFGLAIAGIPHFGADAIWYAMALSAVAAALMATAYYRYGKWRSLHMGLPTEIEVEEEALADANPQGRMQTTG
jgi:putative MATE family efflux protein